LSTYQPTGSYKQYWNAATGLITFWNDRHNEADKAKLALQNYKEQSLMDRSAMGEEDFGTGGSLQARQAGKGVGPSAGGSRGDSAGGGGFLENLAEELAGSSVVAPVAPVPLVEAIPEKVLRDVMKCMKEHGRDILGMLRS
jgi:hypothetical protein